MNEATKQKVPAFTNLLTVSRKSVTAIKMNVTKLFLLLLLVSCDYGPYIASDKEKLEVFNKTNYDKKVISAFPAYDALAKTILLNIDTLMAYRNANNWVIKVSHEKDGEIVEQRVPEHNDCFEYRTYNDSNEVTPVPPFLRRRIDSLWENIGKPSFQLCSPQKLRPVTLTITVDYVKREHNVLECHSLYWRLQDSSFADSFSYLKDTALSSECIYRVSVAENHSGW